MAIKIADKIITLNTKNTSYQMMVGEHGHLLHTYFGDRLSEDDDMSYLIPYIDRGFSGNPSEAETNRTYSLDTLPMEYGFNGSGDYRISSFNLKTDDGVNGSELKYVSCSKLAGKYSIPNLPASYALDNEQVDTLKVTLADARSNVYVDLLYGVFEERDVITRSVVVRNESDNRVYINKVYSASIDLAGGDYDLIGFYGKHGMERIPERINVGRSRQMVSSMRGHSSHHENSFVVVCDMDTNEDYGRAFGFSLVYSGNFACELQKDAFDVTRVAMGISGDCFEYELKSGEAFYAPELVMTYSGSGLTGMSQNMHRFVRHNICRGKYKYTRRPVLINNWEATYFDFDGDKLVQIAETASKLGVEMFVLDDGWFGIRDFDDKGLGDWIVNEEKLGCTLGELAKRINECGMKFGLWFEPEMVSENSNMYKTHPEWAFAVPGRKPVRGRMQLLLDFSRKEVVDAIFDMMTNILDNANVEYIKWDMNRSIADVYSAVSDTKNRGTLLYRYILGVYDLADRLLKRYPDLLIEGCAGGGGRFDLGMLYYTPQFWCSDNTDAIERLQIQYGTSFGYPVSTVGAHVSAAPNHQTGRVTPFNTRGVVAMSGSFGYELDLNLISDEEKQMVTSQIEEFKKYWNALHNGLYYRLTNPVENTEYCAWECVTEDRNEAVVSLVKTHRHFNEGRIYIKLKGLDIARKYEIKSGCSLAGKIMSGQALMKGGLFIEYDMLEYEATMIHLVAVE